MDDLTEALEERIFGVLRVPEMKSYYTVAYPAGGIDIATFDSGLLREVKSCLVDVTDSDRKPIPPADEEPLRMWMIRTDVNHPKLHGWISEADGSDKFVIAPEPSGKTVHVSYYRAFSSLTSSTNAVFLEYPHIWLHGLLAEVNLYLRDFEMFKVWEQKFAESIQLANERGRGRTDAHKGQGAGPQHKQGRVF